MNMDQCILKYSEADYRRIAYGLFTEYSEDELAYRYKKLDKDSENEGIFSLLYLYANEVLTKRDGKLAVKMEQVLGWNSISKRLGQDLFTTAWLAYRDCNNFAMERSHTFIWPAVISTDDVKLNAILKKGLAENHFHLHGSTQSFALSWASLMNHPNRIDSFIKIKNNFAVNRDLNISRGIEDNVLPWKKRLVYAAMIRALLFQKMILSDEQGDIEKKFEAFCGMPLVEPVQTLVASLRKAYGIYLKQPEQGERCLDYTMARCFYDVQPKADNRLLSGERAFLYNCFVRIYQQKENNSFSLYEQKMFYIYLLIKHQFRSELIQVNHRVGFNNFSEYQSRKNQLFGQYDEYNVEAQRLAVTAARKENYIKSFETRIMVQESQEGLRSCIESLDKQINFSDKEDEESREDKKDKESKNYYVLHFRKEAFGEAEISDPLFSSVCPRNVATRLRAETGARELRKYIMYEQGKAQRIYGIDACSNEIGCRPETFATEFRYLRKISKFRYEIPWYRTAVERYEELGITYHAGEDFLDITDGIRAIDEAISFLELDKNDRLGHAIALGIVPKDYYEQKRMVIYQSLQDYLDDLVWLLYRSTEWNVTIPADRREEMRRKARELFEELYKDHLEEIAKLRSGDILDAYYDSWHLRGDHPSQYINGKFEAIIKLRTDPYERYMIGEVDKERLQKLRQDKTTVLLYYLYHYDNQVKKNALKSYNFKVEKWYIDLVENMQRALRKRIAEKGIAIECNPTSNVLISNFMYYVKHPAMVFNHYRLDGNSEEPNLWISINTDDIGVFDTSLTYEYALLFRALTMYRHAQNNWNDEAVYEYLDALRENGLGMAFKDLCIL